MICSTLFNNHISISYPPRRLFSLLVNAWYSEQPRGLVNSIWQVTSEHRITMIDFFEGGPDSQMSNWIQHSLHPSGNCQLACATPMPHRCLCRQGGPGQGKGRLYNLYVLYELFHCSEII